MNEYVKTSLTVNAVSVLWYPFWLGSAHQEKWAAIEFRPSHWGKGIKIYNGFPLNAAFQWCTYYPIIQSASYLQKEHNVHELIAHGLCGVAISPICAVWKTCALSSSPLTMLQSGFGMKNTQNVYYSDVNRTGYAFVTNERPCLFRGLHVWAFRGAIVVPMILQGRKWTLPWLSDGFISQIGATLIPATIATIIPSDLLTGILNGDPHRSRYSNASQAVHELIRNKGWRGWGIGFPLRLVAFSIECTLLPFLLKRE